MQNDNKNILVLPSMKHRMAAIEYVSEFIEKHDDINGIGIDSDVVSDYDAYGNWLYWLYGEKSARESEMMESAEGDSFTYFYVDETDNKIIGTISIRKENELAREYGNLGFAVRPSMRGQGYGTSMVEAALSLCSFLGMKDITAVCRKDNSAAIRLLTSCGFCSVLETEKGFLKYLRKA